MPVREVAETCHKFENL